jgi:hypothetical protein
MIGLEGRRRRRDMVGRGRATAGETDSRKACHLARRRSSLIGSVSRLPAMD